MRILQAYKDSEIAVIGDCNEYFSMYRNQPIKNMFNGNNFKQVINANKTRGSDLLDAAYTFATKNEVRDWRKHILVTMPCMLLFMIHNLSLLRKFTFWIA